MPLQMYLDEYSESAIWTNPDKRAGTDTNAHRTRMRATAAIQMGGPKAHAIRKTGGKD
jgi:hypothetical protein